MNKNSGADLNWRMHGSPLRLCYWGYAESSIPGVPEHSHDFWQAQFSLGGRCRLSAGDKVYELSGGDLLFIPPHVEHSLKYETPYLSCTYKFFYNAAISAEPIFVGDSKFSRGVLQASMAILKSTFPEQFFNRPVGTVIMPQDSYQLCMEHYLAGVLAVLMRPETAMPSVLAEIYRVLEKNPQIFSVSQAAECCGYSRNYFCTLIKKAAGVTAREFLNRLRLECAKRYLHYSGKTLSEIAALTGFSSQFHFSDFFKRETGMPPSVFRRGKGEEENG